MLRKSCGHTTGKQLHAAQGGDNGRNMQLISYMYMTMSTMDVLGWYACSAGIAIPHISCKPAGQVGTGPT
jgi:hypothetical protein